jgi:hypothetical protein
VDLARLEEGEDTVHHEGAGTQQGEGECQASNPRSRFAILSLHFVDETRAWGSLPEGTSFDANERACSPSLALRGMYTRASIQRA